MNIIFFQRVLPSYRTSFFKNLLHANTNLIFVYGNSRKNEFLNTVSLNRDRVIEVRNHYLFSKRIYISNYLKLFLRVKPGAIVIEDDVRNLNIYYFLLLKLIFKFDILIWSLGYSIKRGFDPHKYFSDRLRLYIYNRSTKIILYGKTGYKLLLSCFSQEKLLVAPNTIDTYNLELIHKKLEEKGKDLIKKELGIKNKFHLVYTGRFLKDKDVHLLIKAFGLLQEKGIDARLSLVGNGPCLDEYKALINSLNISEIYFCGEVYDDYEAGAWIFASDIFIIPGRMGNSVVHSFAFGVPVISQRKPEFFDGEGADYLIEGFNGELCAMGDSEDLACKMENLLINPQRLKEYKINAEKTAKEKCSMELMLNAFNKFFDEICNNEKN